MSNIPLARTIVITDDGSPTIFIPDLKEHYHSIHGSIQESAHVYINAGFNAIHNTTLINVFEVGFGTGLNALLTLNEAIKRAVAVNYTTIEKYPLMPNEYEILHFANTPTSNRALFKNMHELPWESWNTLNPNFRLKKIHADLTVYKGEQEHQLIYFDAFNPEIQPDLWTADVFEKMYQMLTPQGVLVTYSAKGMVRRNMISAGFRVERLPGPPGKREILRGTRLA